MSKYHMLKDQKILYVEDEKDIREELVDLLSLKAKEVIEATNGQEGFDLYVKHKPDIIITDIKMPVLDGIGMIRKIRETDGDIPIVITSAFENSDYLKESIELHVDKFITKPIDVSILLQILNQLSVLIYQKKELEYKTKELERIQKLLSNAVLYTTSDLKGNITSVSKAFEKFSGFKEKDLLGKNHSIFRSKDTPKKFYTNMWEKLNNNEEFSSEMKNYDKDRNEYWSKITIYPMFDENNKKIGYGSYRENITDKKILEYVSTHDTLTGVYNREFFQKELTKKTKSANRYDQSFALAMVDVDNFKNVNDTYGHQVGDEVLKKLADSINKNIREDDVFARWGGEEFVIIANGADINSIIELIKKIQKEIIKVDFGVAKNVTASYGLTVYKEKDNEESILKRADEALYLAKEKGRDRYEVVE